LINHEREQWEVLKGFVGNSEGPVVLQKPVPKLLSLVTFFAAAKKVTPPPGRRLLQRTARNQSNFPEEKKRPNQIQKPKSAETQKNHLHKTRA
jgi:hypothetical protein